MDPEVAFRTCVEAIARRDVRQLFDVVGGIQFPLDKVRLLADQALRADTANTAIGALGGSLHVLFLGIQTAQRLQIVESPGDESEAMMLEMAIRKDDPMVLNILEDWVPGWRFCEHPGEKPTVETTAEFLDESGAPKCAARTLERQEDLCAESRGEYLHENNKASIVGVARRILERGRTEDEFTKTVLETLVHTCGSPQVVCVPFGEVGFDNVILTVGLMLLGRPELALPCTTESTAIATIRVHQLVMSVLSGEAPIGERTESDLLGELARLTSHLRAPTTPLFLRV